MSEATSAVPLTARIASGAEVAARIGDTGVTKSALGVLAQRIEALPAVGTDVPLTEVAEAVGNLVAWLFSGARVSGEDPPPTLRLRALIRATDVTPAWRARVQGALQRLMREVDLAPLFEIGLPNDRGLYEETMDRLARRILPRPRDPENGRELLGAVLPDLEHAAWLSTVPLDLVSPMCALFGDSPTDVMPLRVKLEEAVVLLATRTSAIGLGADLRERSPAVSIGASPFFLLPRLCDAVFSGIGSTAACYEQIAQAREVLQAVLAHLDQFGVSVDVVYRIEVIERNLDRIAELLALVGSSDRVATEAAACALLGRLAAAQVRDRSIRDMVRTNGRLLARKVVERAGSSGDHYITSSRREWRLMFLAAAGGGLVTVGTTALKYAVVSLHLPLFPEGVLASMNYAGSFLLMQLFGFALATKQPSMVAASLAGSLKSARGELDLTELVDLIARICRSQFAAALGNVVVGFCAGLAFDVLWVYLTGVSYLSPKQAEHTLHALDPFHSGTVLFATITGVFLWIASLGAGWLENFAVFRRIPDGIAHHPLGRVFGRKRMERLAEKFQHGIAGIGGNVSIGLLLGLMPVFGAFFGVPLEVRHVTLSTVSVALSLSTHGVLSILNPALPRVVLGIFFILCCNFGVSFVLALWVAMRARGVSNQGLRLVRALWHRFYAHPLMFLWPPREKRPESPPPP